MNADPPLLSVEGLEVRFGGQEPAVCGLDLTVLRGQTVAVVGESGSGKSTAAAAILGLLAPGGRITAGRIAFDGRDIASSDRKADSRLLRSIRGRDIGYVPQDPMTNLNPVWKVGFQIREALRVNTDGRDARRRAVELLAEAGMPDPQKQAGRYPHQLSGGMCQRALIAIGLAGRPRLLIADEPTSALDVTVQRQVLDHLQRLTTELGTALLLITHDLALAAERAEAVVVVHRGKVVESGAAQQILRSPEHEYTRRLVAAAPSLIATRRRERAVQAEFDDILVASELTKVYRESHGAPWRRTEFRAVDAVSFRLRRASTLAIVGESGSGKSTLARMVLGLLRPTSGTVVFGGTEITDHLGRDGALAFRRRIQPVLQNPYSSLDPRYTVYRAIEEPLRIHRIGDRRQREHAVRELVDQVALPSSVLGRLPRELSGGQRQRVAIARALALRPEVLVCDEAVSALDVLVQAQILDLLTDLQTQLGLTYLFISHDLAVIRQIADDVLVMRAGRVVERAPTEELFSRPGHEYTRELLQAIPGASARSR
ncbi:ABC transporter ATP-binding protein [Mycobacterium sp. 852002-51163_SCH5372311]|uniref:dipeptide ABC transporter ATP-binding protein n=1 Tax=Mycobacterium sp. 852002-51163_SCH5372311 TaxID=1834097 RepID=UPI0007FCFA0F|nr:ABC transporter ATP-binding protein [Mycobacterium sp. 852002-51163_SCH5372311]OBF86794.1 ABC transporter ATP-binding protein [Mycobacterium sp. 852002-51163_SCH5372311]